MQELEHRTRPAVGEDQWRPVADAIEMNVDVLDACRELREAVEFGIPFAPVVAIHTIRTQRLHEIEIGAIGPRVLEPRAARHLVPFIGAVLVAFGLLYRLRNIDPERSWFGHDVLLCAPC